jgi:hypothetical protein
MAKKNPKGRANEDTLPIKTLKKRCAARPPKDHRSTATILQQWDTTLSPTGQYAENGEGQRFARYLVCRVVDGAVVQVPLAHYWHRLNELSVMQCPCVCDVPFWRTLQAQRQQDATLVTKLSYSDDYAAYQTAYNAYRAKWGKSA